MRRMRRQEGQALVAALVVMTLLFAMAGGLAVAVSAALGAQGPSTQTYLRDVQAASATAAVASLVAGSSGTCPAAGTTVYGDVSAGQYSCHEIDLVAPDKMLTVPLQWSGACASSAVPAAGRVSAWVNAKPGTLNTFFIDGAATGCSPGAGACTGSQTTAGPSSFLLISDCPTPGPSTRYLHVGGTGWSARVARVATLAAFIPAQTIQAPPAYGPGPIATARLHGSSRPLDLVVANRGSGCLAIFTGVGDGTFSAAPAASYCTGPDISGLAVGDFGNGAFDLAVTSYYGNTVTVLLGNGGGTFPSVRQYRLSSRSVLGPVAIAVGHLANSDEVDIAVANSIDRSVSILPGSGGGAFGSPLKFDVGDAPTAIAVLDFGGGGGGSYVAVAKTTGAGGALSVYKLGDTDAGDHDGDFSKIGTYQLAGPPGAMTVGYFDGSGRPDLAVALPSSNQVQVLLGTQQGRLSFAPALTGVAGSPAALVAADFGGGAGADLAIANGTTGTVSVLLGQGNGTFQPIAGGDLPAGVLPAGVAAGDFDGSATSGLAVANFGSGTVSVMLRNRSKVFSIVAGAPDGSAYNEADLVWSQPSRGDTLFFEGGLG